MILFDRCRLEILSNISFPSFFYSNVLVDHKLKSFVRSAQIIILGSKTEHFYIIDTEIIQHDT